jgi:hypothetical protein
LEAIEFFEDCESKIDSFEGPYVGLQTLGRIGIVLEIQMAHTKPQFECTYVPPR